MLDLVFYFLLGNNSLGSKERAPQTMKMGSNKELYIEQPTTGETKARDDQGNKKGLCLF